MKRTQHSVTDGQPWINQAFRLSPSARQLRGRALVGLFAAFSQVFVSGAAIAQSLPTGGTVTSGTATITTPSATSMQINQATQKAVLEWTGFNIGAGNSVVFVQPNSSSVALNRVIGASASQIYGNLSANGQVFLVNANGIYFAPGAQVEVGGLVASTLGLSNANFLAGNYAFENGGAAGSVVNAGSITALAGYAALVGPQVSNTGVITARLGSVALAAGNKVTLDIVGDGLMNVVVDAAAVGALALNSGTLAADGGQVLMSVRSADAILDTVLNTTGVIRANTLTAQNGKIILDGGERGVTSATGMLQATGGSGGSISVSGNSILTADATSMNASGLAGGGSINVQAGAAGIGSDNTIRGTYVAETVLVAGGAGNDTFRVDSPSSMRLDGKSGSDNYFVTLGSTAQTVTIADSGTDGGFDSGFFNTRLGNGSLIHEVIYTVGTSDATGSSGVFTYKAGSKTQQIAFSGLEPTEDLTAAALLTVNGTTAGTISVGNGGLSAGNDPITTNPEQTYLVDLAGADEDVTFRNKSSLVLNAPDGGNTITVNLPTQHDTASTNPLTSVTVNAGNGTNTVTL